MFTKSGEDEVEVFGRVALSEDDTLRGNPVNHTFDCSDTTDIPRVDAGR